MDITSYLLGKGQGGGEVNLQDKEVTITQNGTQTITKDSGYDGLNSVEVTTNIPQPSGTINITTNGTHDVTNYASAEVSVGGTPTDFTELTNLINGVLNSYNNATMPTFANSDEPMTLYTPATNYNYYLINKAGNTNYKILWFNMKGINYYSGNISFPTVKITQKINSISQLEINNIATQTNYGYTDYYESDSMTSLEDCLSAIQSNTTTYTKKSVQMITGIGNILYRNIGALKGDGVIMLSNVGKLSSNETIEVIS